MKPDISEFSYGYAITDELVHWHGTSLTAAPYFPSLYAEGQQGGGYDLRLDRPGIPLFLQFKLSDCMVRNSAQEVREGRLTAPFYRMHVRPARHSQQHEMLLDLESTGNEVYYSAPAFHTPGELNFAYLNHGVRQRSLWLRPSEIGPLPDHKDHHVAFNVPGVPHFCSESRPLDTNGDFDSFKNRVENSLRQKGQEPFSRERLDGLAHEIQSISEKRQDISYQAKRRLKDSLSDRHPLDIIAFYAQVYMDCCFFVVRWKE